VEENMMTSERADLSPLGADETGLVGGGMKWDHNYHSADVIDARGGQFGFMGLTFSFDVNGKISDIS